ncbi:MAG: hypothetical protein AB7S74_17865 [Hyphomicrobium sp.]
MEEAIREAFPRLPYSHISESRADIRREKPSFLGLNWWEVDYAEAKHQSYFTFDFTEEEATYYCPLMLLSCLHAGGKGHEDYLERFFFPLDESSPQGTSWNPDPEGSRRFNLKIVAFRESFSISQKQAIACFFSWLASLDHDDAIDALNDYWRQFLLMKDRPGPKNSS